MLEIVEVPGAVRRAAEEARDALLVTLPRGESSARPGAIRSRQRQQIVLVAAGAVQQQERRPARVRSRNEAMDEAEIVAPCSCRHQTKEGAACARALR